MMTKHTPGPWIAEYLSPPANIWVIVSDSEYCIADLASIKEAEANARLIAAAPDLLEACEVLVNWYRTNEPGLGTPPEVGKAEQAIAIAKGLNDE